MQSVNQKKFTSTYIYALLILMMVFVNACSNRKKEYYHSFRDHTWKRFDILNFQIPIEKTGVPFDFLFFAHPTKDFEFDNLNFNMVMTTPSGEERIREYNFPIKNFNTFYGTCTGDSCEEVIPLKTGMVFTDKGILKIEIENLVPRLETRGLLGVGIRMVEAR